MTVLLLIAALLFPQATKPAPTVAGKWTMHVQSAQGAMDSALELKQDGKKITGTTTSQMGSAPIEGEFVDGKLYFSMAYNGQGGAMNLSFNATLKSDGTLAGTLTAGQTEIPFTAERVKDETPAKDAAPPIDLTGKWQMAVEMSVGTGTPMLELKQDAGKLTGTYTGRYGSSPLTGTVKDRAITFTFSMGADAGSVALTFTGEVSVDGQSLKGNADMGDVGAATWTAKRVKG